MNTKVFKALFADKINLLLVGALALVGGGASLNAGTTAYFTDTVTQTASFTTANLDLTSAAMTALTVSDVIPGDAIFRKISVANTSTNALSVPYYLSVNQDSGDAEVSGANGVYLVALRCYDEVLSSGSIPATATIVDCDGATALSAELIGGTGAIHAAATKWDITGGAGLTTSNVVPSGQSGGAAAGAATIVIAGSSAITGVPIQTGAAGTVVTTNYNTNCASTTLIGACLMNGPSGDTGGATGLSNPALTGLSVAGVTTNIPSSSSVTGLAGGGTDKFTLIFYVPTSTTVAQLGNKTGSFTLAFTGVQPSGQTLNNAGTAFSGR